MQTSLVTACEIGKLILKLQLHFVQIWGNFKVMVLECLGIKCESYIFNFQLEKRLESIKIGVFQTSTFPVKIAMCVG